MSSLLAEHSGSARQMAMHPHCTVWAGTANNKFLCAPEKRSGRCARVTAATHIYIYSRKNRKHNDQNVFLCLCTYHLKHMQVAEQIGNMHISWLCLKQLEICLHKTCSFGDPKIDSFLRSRSEGRWKNRANGCRSNEDLEFTLHI